MDPVKITIDGKEVVTTKGKTVIQAAAEAGVAIPHYCYHPKLSIAGNCRMCMVEIEKMPKLQIACNTQVAEGMGVLTQSPKVLAVRKAVLEFLLINHPVDCPICDQAGECQLQNYYMEHNRQESRFDLGKVHDRKKTIFGPNVVFDGERCIKCTRCALCQEVTKTDELAVINRGDHSTISCSTTPCSITRCRPTSSTSVRWARSPTATFASKSEFGIEQDAVDLSRLQHRLQHQRRGLSKQDRALQTAAE
jgi:NADH-quinone oxidoreductase subunit G